MSPAEEFSKRQAKLKKDIEELIKSSIRSDAVLASLQAKFTKAECPAVVRIRQDNLLLTLKHISLHDILVKEE